MEERTTRTADSEKSIPELTKQLADQTTALVREEVELAKAELREKGRAAGIGAGMYGAAGVLGLFALGALTACLILVLAIVLDAWVAALVVAAGYGAIAGLMALRARREVDKGLPPVPDQAIETTKEDVRWTKERARRARR
jgi:uncharacterized membrane protein YqjE